MSEKSIVQEARDIQLAMELITLGARLQMLESETQLSRGRLIKLYKELRGSPPPKGMLPFSTDWFMTWSRISTLPCSAMPGNFFSAPACVQASTPSLRLIGSILNSARLRMRHRYWR